MDEIGYALRRAGRAAQQADQNMRQGAPRYNTVSLAVRRVDLHNVLRGHTALKIRNALYLYLLLPAVYIVVGDLSLYLAVSPGYATELFLPSGLAIGSVFIFGFEALPGVFAGSFILNVLAGVHHHFGVSALAAFAIACGSSIQAAFGGKAIGSVIGQTRRREDILYLLLYAPIICCISASISLVALEQIVGPFDFARSWLTWWLGDTLGVVFVMPILFVYRATVDIEERKQFEEKQQLLINELHHRVNNLLSVVMAIAHQSKDCKVLEGRLMALSHAFRHITEGDWKGVNVRDIVEANLNPFVTRWNRQTEFLSGPPCKIDPAATQNLSLVLYELATNASKYGALSTMAGRIRLTWEVDGDALRFRWIEMGGPATSGPEKKGFGTSLIGRLYPSAKLNYCPAFTCEFDVPLNGGETMRSKLMKKVL